MFKSDYGHEIPDSFYSSGWTSLQSSQNTHGFFSTPNTTVKNFSNSDSTKSSFTVGTQTNFSNHSLNTSNNTSNIVNKKLSDFEIMNSDLPSRPLFSNEPNIVDQLESTNDNESQETPNAEEGIEPSETSVLESGEISFNPMAGMISGTVNNSVMGALNQKNYTNTMQGNGPKQGDFNAQRTAQNTLDNRNIASSVSSTIMSASSLLGPEGFIAGTIVGAGIDIATESGAFDSSPTPVNTN